MRHSLHESDDERINVEPLLMGKRRGTMENRLWAKLIDLSVVLILLFVVQFFFPRLWIFLVGPFLWGFIELLNDGQSPGKWLLGLQVVDSLGAPYPSFWGCIVRNLPFIILSIAVFYFDSYIGFAAVIFSIVLLALETYFVLLIQTGIRIGDVLSTTHVQDYRDQHMRFIEQYLKEDAE